MEQSDVNNSLFNCVNTIDPVQIPQERLITTNLTTFYEHWSYVLYCSENNIELYIVESKHIECDNQANSLIFSNRHPNRKVIRCGQPFLNIFSEWEEEVLVVAIGAARFLNYACPICGKENNE